MKNMKQGWICTGCGVLDNSDYQPAWCRNCLKPFHVKRFDQ